PILKPKQVFSVEKNRATFNKAAKNYAVVGAIYGLLIAIALFFISSIIRTIAVGFGASGLGAITGVTSIALALAGFVAGIILMVVSGVVGAAFVWACCKLLGGKASFNQIFYLQSVYLLPYIIVLIAAAIIGVIPIIGWLIALIAVLYNLYLLYLVIKEANEFSRGKAIAAIVLMVVIMIVLSIIFSAVTASILPKISPPDVIRT
ncbi:YIP1 family protein, partial [Candidatus Micrarchaeota archaeon]|nr:YIP1 family protein [Candidatus Micrarchaeota archaeon]